MSLSKEAIKHIQDFTIAGQKTETDDNTIILPDGYRIEDLEEYQDQRNRFRGIFNTHRIDDFAAYANAQNGKPPVFVSQDTMRARAIFDMGDIDNPLHCKHTAIVDMKSTPEYAYLNNSILGMIMNQQELAEFMEDYHQVLQCAEAGGDEIPMKKAIAAIRRVTIERKAKQESDIQSYTSKQSALEEITAKSGDNQLPAFIVMNTPLYIGMSTYSVKMRISMLTRSEPAFKIRAINIDKIKEACAEEFKGMITAAVDTDTVYIGGIDLR